MNFLYRLYDSLFYIAWNLIEISLILLAVAILLILLKVIKLIIQILYDYIKLKIRRKKSFKNFYDLTKDINEISEAIKILKEEKNFTKSRYSKIYIDLKIKRLTKELDHRISLFNKYHIWKSNINFI